MTKEWEDMQGIWTQTNPAGPDINEILNYVIKQSEGFDRKVHWRNRREWIGGGIGLALMAALMSKFQSTVEIAFGISMAVLVVGICLHLWLQGRSEGPVDPSQSRPRYRAALERKFNKQIRMLRKATYWFLIPVFVTGSATAWSYLGGSPGDADLLYFPVILAGTILAWWANNVAGVKSIRSEWEKVRRALDDGEIL